ncbi:hypothetical protein SAMN04488009_3589 [Maribacter sedimenticola]|uniref:Lipocalin-like domain-containing protein n=1 Tax=Maribacter sedimenticola TaxID=228956 RepID=A0ABY1SLD2_9FLAO|nr:hypothetical protein [Maribacter sedimenticola]SNR75098.1 hypothetical protein SAMN04488009_3589 [Maribacter sedimenticola]
MSILSCGDRKPENEIVGKWSAKYIILDTTEFLGYLDSKLSYIVKPAIFSKNGKLIIFLEHENRKNIVANYIIRGTDSIVIKSNIDLMNGQYKIEITDEKGKRIMKLKAPNKQMYFQQLFGSISL